jgi:hypothetical protein
VLLPSGKRVRITVRSGKPIRPTPEEEAKRADEFKRLGLEAPRLRLNPDRFMDSEHSEHNRRTLLSPLMDGNRWAGEVRRTFIAELTKARSRFKGRKPGALSAKTRYIHRLADKHPGESAKKLYQRANKKRRGKLPTFINIVSKHRSTRK